jgi:hypothetical protein
MQHLARPTVGGQLLEHVALKKQRLRKSASVSGSPAQRLQLLEHGEAGVGSAGKSVLERQRP